MDELTKKKEWMKNAMIVFLVIMLLLTLFSNTITNYTLPQVSTSYVQNGEITEAVRGSGTVAAAEAYDMIAAEVRKIESVAVAKGDHVEKGDVIYHLEDQPSDAVMKAEAELADLEYKYVTSLLTSKMTANKAKDVYENGASSFDSYVAKLSAMEAQVDNAQAEVDRLQGEVYGTNVAAKEETAKQAGSTDPYRLEIELASQAKTDAQNAFDNGKAYALAALNANKAELQARKSSLEAAIPSESAMYERIRSLLISISDGVKKSGQEGVVIYGTEDYAELKVKYNALKDQIAIIGETTDPYDNQDYATLLAEADEAFANFSAISEVESIDNEIRNIDAEIAIVNATSYTSQDSYKEMVERVITANDNLNRINSYNTQKSAQISTEQEIKSNELAVAKEKLTTLKADYDQLVMDISKALEAEKASEDISRKQQEIESLKLNSMGTEVVAGVSGVIQELTYVSGEKTEVDKSMVKIIPDGKDLTLTISVSKANAAKVAVGANATPNNSWYYGDAHIVLKSITDDLDSNGTNKKLNFTVSGENISIGEQMTVSVDSKTTSYDCVIPKSALRSDNSGTFIYVLTQKASPLGTRYYAEKRNVKKLAEDDNNYAISGEVTAYEYVITDSDKPIEAGKQVRLNIAAD